MIYDSSMVEVSHVLIFSLISSHVFPLCSGCTSEEEEKNSERMWRGPDRPYRAQGVRMDQSLERRLWVQLQSRV